MSNYWGYVCLSHDPPMYSERWLNHGEEALRAAWEQSRTPEGWPAAPKIPGVNDLLGDDPMPLEHRGFSHSSPGAWLWEHLRCRVGLHDQRGALIELTSGIPDTTRAVQTAVVLSLRYAAQLAHVSGHIELAEALYDTARDTLHTDLTPSDDLWCCPVCEEVQCDDDCPIRPYQPNRSHP